MEGESDLSDYMQSDSDENENENIHNEDHSDLSSIGAASTSVKFQSVKEQSFQTVEEGNQELARHILESCQPSDKDLVHTSKKTEKDDVSTEKGTRVLQQNFIQVQQQFEDVTVHGTRNLTIGGTQNISQLGATQVDNETQLTFTDKIQNRTASRIKTWTNGMVKTSALERVLQKLNKKIDWITIKGCPGEGKTTVAYMALEELHRSGRQVFQVTSPKEFSEVISTSLRPAIMLDDIFGNLEFELNKLSQWKSVLHGILDDKEHRSHERVKIALKKGINIIFVVRDYILKSALCDLGRISDVFTNDLHVIDMSHGIKRDDLEKVSIWKAISESGGISLDKNTVHNICLTNCPHGFPHVCRLFVTIWSKDQQTTPVEFFKTPLQFLNQTIAKFMQDKSKLALFREMIKGDGRVSLRELGKLDNGYEINRTACDLVDTYLRKEEDNFLFHHPSIYDSVAYNMCQFSPLFVIQNCKLSFIQERLRFQPQLGIHQGASGRDPNLAVLIPRCYIADLAKRLANEISNRNLNQVLSQKIFADESFIPEVMNQIKLSLAEIVRLRDGKTHEQFLHLLSSNKSPQLLKYIETRNDIQLTQSDMNCILYGYASLQHQMF